MPRASVDPRASAILRPLRTTAPVATPPPAALVVERPPLPRVGPWRVGLRLGIWGRVGLWFAAVHLADRLRGRGGIGQLAARVREAFERIGGTALKLGQQLSVRTDLLPVEVCLELGSLLDAVPPMPVAAARAVVEEALGRPADEVFEGFGDMVLGSASIAVVYGARLRTGERVAVKVRRPDVVPRILADLSVFDLLTWVGEALTLVRPGHFRHLRADLRTMLTDELDLRQEADHQARFRELAEVDALGWLTAPRVYGALSTEALLVSGWVDGVSAVRILAAVDDGDEVRLAAWAAQGIDPEVLGERIFELSQWSRLECPFFQADPHPGNLIVQPGGVLVMLDFGSCGSTSRELREQLVEMSRRMLDEDFHGAAAMSLAMLSPLPHIDLEELRHRLEQALWHAHLPTLVDDAAWWERTSINLWLSLLEVTAEFQVPANIDMLRGVRATLLYDTLACRLHPALNRRKQVRRWFRRSAERAHRRLGREADRRGEAAMDREWRVLAAELAEVMDKGRYTVGHLARNAAHDFRTLQDAVGFAVAQFLRLVVIGGGLIAVGVVFSLLFGAFDGHEARVEAALAAAASHPLVWGLGLALGIVWYRRVQYRLHFREPGRG